MEIVDVFATPVTLERFNPADPLNAALTAALVSEAASTPGILRSNVGGWHSVPDLALRRGGPFPALMQRIVDTVGGLIGELAARQQAPQRAYRYGIQSWAMVMGPGHYTVLHDHAEAHISGVYYADAGDDVEGPSGHLAFGRPGGGFAEIPGLTLFPTTFSVRPQTGMMVLFPGYLQHYVHPYRGQRPRVAISFNVRAEAAGPPPGGGLSA